MTENLGLLPHESVAAFFIAERAKTVLFDANGLGKTISVLGGLKQAFKGVTGGIKCVVVVPNTIINQWVTEIIRFIDWKVVVAAGNLVDREIKYNYFIDCEENAILVTTYTLIGKDKFFKTFYGDFLILDEAYLFRNANTKLYNNLKFLVKHFERITMLTGNINDFNSIQLGNLFKLLDSNLDVNGKSSNVLLEEFKDYYLLRTIPEVFPDDPAFKSIPLIEFIGLNISENQKELLLQAGLSESNSLRVGVNSSNKYSNVKRKILLSDRIFGAVEKSAKEKFILEYIKLHDSKVVIYVPDIQFFNLILGDLSGIDLKFVWISGTMRNEFRQRSLDLFNLDENVKCLVITGVGKLGLNLQIAHRLLFMGIPKTLFELNQMITRLYRYGQKATVECIIPYYKETFEDEQLHKFNFSGFNTNWGEIG